MQAPWKFRVVLATMVVAFTTPWVCVLEAQGIVLEEFERWELHWVPGTGTQPKTALLLLYVRNDTPRLIKHWRALVVVRDSTDSELFRVAIEKERADLAPRARARVEMEFSNRADASGEPYDHLLENDTTNLRVTFDEVRIVDDGDVAYLPSGMPMCFNPEAWDRLAEARYGEGPEGAWRSVSDSVGCQWTLEPLTLEFLAVHGKRGARVRLPLMTRAAWVFAEDLQRP